MTIDASKVSMWASILSIPSLVGWYITGYQTLISPLQVGPKSSIPSLLMGAFVLFAIVALVANALAHRGISLQRQQTTQPQPPPRADTSTSQLRSVDEFYRTYDNVLLTECETNIRVQSDQYQPGVDREKFLIRLLATVIVLDTFERAWLNIYASQLKLLNRLATVPSLSLDEVRHVYNEAAQHYPEPYKQKMPLEVWLAFLRNWILVLEQGTSVQITVRGREFLKYLVQMGYDPNNKVW